MAQQKVKNNKKKSNLLTGIIVAICTIIGFFLFLYLADDTANNNSIKQGTVITQDGVKNVYSNDFTLIKEETKGTREKDGTYTIKGKLKQNIEGSYTSIFVTMTMLDRNGKKVRDTAGLQFANYLGNNLWEFTVYGNDADGIVTDYKLSNCYGY